MKKSSISTDLKQLQDEALERQNIELSTHWSKLSPESRMQVILLVRQLIEVDKTNTIFAQLMAYFVELNEEGQRLVLVYAEALALNPKYRMKNHKEELS